MEEHEKWRLNFDPDASLDLPRPGCHLSYILVFLSLQLLTVTMAMFGQKPAGTGATALDPRLQPWVEK